MPRQSRIDTTGALHYFIARGIERREIFEDDQDRYVLELVGYIHLNPLRAKLVADMGQLDSER